MGNENTRYTDACDKDAQSALMMGPNAMRIMEELTACLPMKDGLRILDLGCGLGATSLLLAEKYGADVFAADLWIPPTENFERFEQRGAGGKIVPLSFDATKEIPFAHGYFDMILSVDAYQYFGGNEEMLPKLLPFVKRGGHVAVAVPGFTQDFPEGGLPPEVAQFWTPEWNFYSLRWWRELWGKAPGAGLVDSREMPCCQQAWDEWLLTSSPYAENDRKMFAAGAGKYFSLIQLIAKKR